MMGSDATNKKGGGVKRFVYNHFPITDWLLNYRWKEDLSHDIIAGITVAIMHIPQGLAYASLAEVEPMVGIYTAVYPVLIYTLLGPSRHVSMGTNPLTSMLTGSIVLKYANEIDQNSLLFVLCMTTGLLQVIFALLRLGQLSWVLSTAVVSGYTTAAAFHVLASQLKGIFGVPIAVEPGPLKLFRTAQTLLEQIDDFNYAALLVSSLSILVLVLNNELLKPKLSKVCSFPVPIQLIVVVAGILAAHFFRLDEHFGLQLVGEVPTGFQTPILSTEWSLYPRLLVDSLLLAVVGYSVTLSMAKIFADKFEYNVDGNQEMLAEGASNVFGAFFTCLTSGASMSRSMVQVNVGGRTQLTSAVSISILVLIIAFAAPLFQSLPKACLSAIIVVALKGMFWQFKDVKNIYKRSKFDAYLWTTSFIATFVLDVDSGLLVAVVAAVVLLIYRSIRVHLEDDIVVVDGEEAQVLRLEGAVSFANFEKTKIRLDHVAVNKDKLVLDVGAVPYVDQAGADMLKKWLNRRQHHVERGDVQKLLANATPRVKSTLLEAGVDASKFILTRIDEPTALQSEIEGIDNKGLEQD